MAQRASVCQYIGTGENFNLHCLSLSLHLSLDISVFPHLHHIYVSLFLNISISFRLKMGKRTEQFGAPCLLTCQSHNNCLFFWRKRKYVDETTTTKLKPNKPRLLDPIFSTNNCHLLNPLIFSLYTTFKGIDQWEKRWVGRGMAFDRSSFKLRFSNNSSQAPSSERPKATRANPVSVILNQ